MFSSVYVFVFQLLFKKTPAAQQEQEEKQHDKWGRNRTSETMWSVFVGFLRYTLSQVKLIYYITLWAEWIRHCNRNKGSSLCLPVEKPGIKLPTLQLAENPLHHLSPSCFKLTGTLTDVLTVQLRWMWVVVKWHHLPWSKLNRQRWRWMANRTTWKASESASGQKQSPAALVQCQNLQLWIT